MSRRNIRKYSWGYALTRLISMPFHRLYYRKLQVKHKEKIPADRPVIFAMNHQNALMDALAIVYNCSRQVVFMARADIFKKKMTARLLYFLKILPVFRIRDGFHSVDQNKEVFKEVFNVLENKRPVALFPEGSHLGERRLRPFKKGASVMAIKAQVPIVPITLINTRILQAPGEFAIHSGTVELIVHDPIPTAGMTLEDRDRLSAATFAAIASALPRSFMFTAKPAGVACVISVVVTNPRAQPASANKAHKVRNSWPSGRTLSAPFFTREPQPQLDEAADESVTVEFSERMFISAA